MSSSSWRLWISVQRSTPISRPDLTCTRTSDTWLSAPPQTKKAILVRTGFLKILSNSASCDVIKNLNRNFYNVRNIFILAAWQSGKLYFVNYCSKEKIYYLQVVDRASNTCLVLLLRPKKRALSHLTSIPPSYVFGFEFFPLNPFRQNLSRTSKPYVKHVKGPHVPV
jgi:hypothetical protein